MMYVMIMMWSHISARLPTHACPRPDYYAKCLVREEMLSKLRCELCHMIYTLSNLNYMEMELYFGNAQNILTIRSYRTRILWPFSRITLASYISETGVCWKLLSKLFKGCWTRCDIFATAQIPFARIRLIRSNPNLI